MAKSPNRAISGRRLLLGTGVLLLLGLAATGWWVSRLQHEAQTAREHLVAARAVLDQPAPTADIGSAGSSGGPPTQAGGTSGRVSGLTSQLDAVCSEAGAADSTLRDLNGQVQGVMPLIGALEGLPGVGERARAQATSLDAGTQLAAAGSSLCDGLGPLMSLVSADSTADGAQPAAQTLKTLVAARPKLAEGLQRLEQLQASLSTLPDQDLDPSSQAGVVALRQRLPQITGLLRDTIVFLDLLGSEGDRRYLLVSQNPDELRATGGYIGSAGVVSVHAGAVSLVEYGTSHAYDTPGDLRAVPPPLFQPYLGAGYWNLDAANWWASFPDSARQMAHFYELSRPDQPVQGVVALDQFGLGHLLEVLGPVAVPEYGEQVSAESLEGQIDRYVHAGPSNEEFGRKQFTAALSVAVLQRMMAAPSSQLPGLVRAVRAGLEEEHLLVWMNDPSAAKVFAERRWDGELLRSAGDGLMLVDTDLQGTKQSQRVTRDANYQVHLGESGKNSATLRVSYTNTSSPEQRPDLPYFVVQYRTFLRVYAPGGASLTHADGFSNTVVTDAECGRTVFAGDVLIPQGSTANVTLEYTLPTTVMVDGAYDLVVQQQPGVPPGTLTVGVTPPRPSPSSAQAVETQLTNAAGHHAHWQLQTTDGQPPMFADRPLPSGQPGGCNQPLVEANPIAEPVRLEIPSAGISAPITELGVDPDGQMEAPARGDEVGWYRMSARAGQPGNSVMSGHVDWAKAPAVFWGLRQLKPGDRIEIGGADGLTHEYAVEWSRPYPTGTAPTASLVGGSFDTLLTLITCDGAFDPVQKVYLERRVVRARLVN